MLKARNLLKNRPQSLELFSWGLLAISVIYTGYLLFSFSNPYCLNSDIVNEISFLQASYEQKTLFPQGFVCGHEYFGLRPILLYWLYYGITKNFMLAFQLETLTTLIILLLVVYFLLIQLSVRSVFRPICLLMLVCFLPNSIKRDTFFPSNGNMMFVIVIMATLALRVSIYKLRTSTNDETKRGRVVKVVGILFVLALLYGFGTIKMLLWLYLPIFAIDVINVIWKCINNTTSNRVDFTECCISGILLLTNGCSYLIFTMLCGDFIVQKSFNIAGIEAWLNWDILSSQICSIINSFGIVGTGALKSTQGLLFLMSNCMAAVELLSIIWVLIRGNKLQKSIVHYWFAVTLAVFIYHVVTGIESSDRYYTPTAYLLPVICCSAFNSWCINLTEKCGLRLCRFALVGILCFFLLNVKLDMGYYSCPAPVLSQVANYIKENGYEYVTASYWNSGVIKGYTNGAVEYQHCELPQMKPSNWFIDINKFSDDWMGKKNILLLTDDEEVMMKQDRVASALLGEYGEKIAEIDVYNLYAFTENPIVIKERIATDYSAGLPAKGVDHKIDYPNFFGFQMRNSYFNEANELVSDGTGACILWGPYSTSVEGTYDITLHYIVDSYTEDNSGYFDVALNAEQQALVEFYADKQTATINNVTLHGGAAFEARVEVPEGMIVRIQSIEYQRKQ